MLRLNQQLRLVSFTHTEAFPAQGCPQATQPLCFLLKDAGQPVPPPGLGCQTHFQMAARWATLIGGQCGFRYMQHGHQKFE